MFQVIENIVKRCGVPQSFKGLINKTIILSYWMLSMLGGGEGKTNHVGWDHPVLFGRNSKYLHDAAAIMKSEKENGEDNIDASQ